MRISINGKWLPKKIKTVLTGLLLFILVFLFVEGLIRIGYSIHRDAGTDREKGYIFTPDLLWAFKPNFKGYIEGTTREFDAHGFIKADSLQISDTTKTKIVFIGDSVTFGYKVSTNETFVEVLDDMSPDIYAINLGSAGYTSYQGYQVLSKYSLQLKPDWVFISFNFNDRRYVVDNDHIDSATNFKRLHAQQKLRIPWLRHVYWYRLIKDSFIKFGIIGRVEDKRIDKMLPRVSPEDYRKNLVKMVELAKRESINAMFLLFRDNPVQTEYLKKGIKLLGEFQYESAIENLAIAIQKDNYFSDLARKYLARAYKAAGLNEDAEKILSIRPIGGLHGGAPLHLDSEYNQIMREVAQEYEVEIIDAASVLDATPSDYLDFCHPDANGHKKIANLIYARLSKMYAWH